MESKSAIRIDEISSQPPTLITDTVNPAIPQRLFAIGKLILAELDVDHALTLAMVHAIEISGARCGMIILFDEKGEIIFITARRLKEENLDYPALEINRTIIDKVRVDGMPVVLSSALELLSRRESNLTAPLKNLSIVCVPLYHQGKIFGVVYLDNRMEGGAFKPEACKFLQSFADFISLAAYGALERKHQHGIHARDLLHDQKYRFESIITQDPKMIEILKLVAQIADTDVTVLIHGESGTGKELIARALHDNGRRKDKPFIPINCSAIPESLLESELFGHVRGAFTGAMQNKPGWFERAEGGTIFLDEISKMTLALQGKLLRVLQTGEYAPVGSTKVCYCHVRIVAATNRNLQKLMREGMFQEDLYYRLRVIDIELPPLRHRKGDIPLLTQHFIGILGAKYGKKNLRLSQDAEALLLAYDFPGNVRELENIIQRAVILAEGEYIEPHHLPASIYQDAKNDFSRKETVSAFTVKLFPFKLAKQQVVEKFEREYLANCLTVTRGNISRAAQIAGIDVKNFYLKVMKYGIDPHAFKMQKATSQEEKIE